MQPQGYLTLPLRCTASAPLSEIIPSLFRFQAEVYNPKAIARVHAEGPAQLGVTLHRKHDAPAGAYYTGGGSEGYMIYLRCVKCGCGGALGKGGYSAFLDGFMVPQGGISAAWDWQQTIVALAALRCCLFTEALWGRPPGAAGAGQDTSRATHLSKLGTIPSLSGRAKKPL